MDMSLQLHILPCTSSDKLKKSFLDQLSLHVELNRKASYTVSLPLIVIFRPQGRPNDEFDGVVLPFLDKVKCSCKDVILFTALATSQLYGRGFTPACASRFKYMDKLFITAGHLDTEINKSTFIRLGDILVKEYGFKQTSGNQPQGERDQGPIQPSGNQDMDKHSISGSEVNDEEEKRKSPCSDANREVDKNMDKHSISGSEANNEEEKRKSPCSDANREVDKSKRSGSHLHKQVYTDSSTEDNRQGNNDNSAENILRSVKEAMEKETTALQRKVEKRFELPPGKLLTILDAVLEELAQKPKTAELLEKYMECTYDEKDNSTGSDAKCNVDKGSGATTSTSGCREPCVSTDHSLNTPGGDAPLQGAALQESGKNSRDPSRTESDKTPNDKDRQRIREQFNNRTAALQKDVETKLKVPPGKLLTILEVVLKYADQERKVTNQSPKKSSLIRSRKCHTTPAHEQTGSPV